jgi:hypothetical protein
MTRPVDAPDWATDVNYADPGKDWDGVPTKVKPSAGEIAQGTVPDKGFAGDYDNYIKNNHGLWLRNHDSIFVGKGFRLADDFTGTAPDTSQLAMTGTIVCGDGHLADAFGMADFFVSAGSDHDHQLLSQALPVKLREFYFAIRINPQTVGATGANTWGLIDLSGGGFSTFFWADPASGKWQFNHPPATALNTGVSYTPGTFDLLEFQRVAGVLTAWINGVQVYSAANASNMVNSKLQLDLQYVANTQAFNVDFYKLWIDR